MGVLRKIRGCFKSISIGYFKEFSKEFQASFKAISRGFQGCFMKTLWVCKECSKGVLMIFFVFFSFSGCLKVVLFWQFVYKVLKESFKGSSRIYQECFKDYSRNFQGISSKFQGMSRKSRMFQGCFLEVSMGFPECFDKGFYIRF